MRSISRVYLRWKQAWQSEQRLHQQKHRALLFWALELQKKVAFDHCFEISTKIVSSVLSNG